MTQRLPVPGSDDGTWGNILNGFLEVSLNSDGTLSTTAVASALPSPIPVANLGTGTASISNYLRGDGTWSVPPGAPVATVFGRTGAIIASTGDYVASQVTGSLVNTNNLSDVADAGSSRANIHIPVLTAAAAVATSNILLTAPGAEFDGYSMNSGDLLLLTAQTTASQNGLYTWTGASATLTRPTEFATGATIKGRTIEIQNGTTYGGTTWVLTTPTAGIAIDTASQAWANPLDSRYPRSGAYVESITAADSSIALGGSTTNPTLSAAEAIAVEATRAETAEAERTRSATITIAASNSSANMKAAADYICSGTSDNIQIQAAFNALPAAGGCVVLSEGNFYLSASITLPAVPFTFEGQGQGATYLQLSNGVSANMLNYTSASNVTFCLFRGMTLYGNASNQTSGIGINLNSTGNFWDIRFQDLFVEDFYTQGIYCSYAHDYVFDHVVVEYCGQSSAITVPAVMLAGGDEAYVHDTLIKLNNGRGFTCTTYGTTFVNSHFVQNAESGLLIAAQNCTIIGCVFDDNSYGSNSYADLRCLNAHTVISANVFFGNTSAAKYSIQLDNTSTSNVVTANSFQGYHTAILNDLDTTYSTIYAGNQGIPDRLLAGLALPTVTVTGSSTLTTLQSTVRVNSTSATTQTLPTATTCPGQTVTVKNVNTGTVTVAGTIDGATNYSLSAQYQFIILQSNGTNWDIVGAGTL